VIASEESQLEPPKANDGAEMGQQPQPTEVGKTELEMDSSAAPAAEAAASTISIERAPTQAQPDSATMLQMARVKRDAGDIKGALDLYERVMHRRPNHLDQVTADLQAIVGAGGAPTSANRLLGEAYAMVGRFKESLEQYRIAMGK
jgi:lipopolysaccharide biosynthesis regulator YciM